MKSASALLYFHVLPSGVKKISTQFQKRQDFRKNFTQHKMSVLIFLQLWSEKFLILRRNEQYIIINVYKSSCNVSVFSHVLMDLEISPQFSKNIEIPYFLKILLVAAELFHAGGQA
jgi:hypothetical protein